MWQILLTRGWPSIRPPTQLHDMRKSRLVSLQTLMVYFCKKLKVQMNTNIYFPHVLHVDRLCPIIAVHVYHSLKQTVCEVGVLEVISVTTRRVTLLPVFMWEETRLKYSILLYVLICGNLCCHAQATLDKQGSYRVRFSSMN